MITTAPRSETVARDPFYVFLERALPAVYGYLWERLPDPALVRQLTSGVFEDALEQWPTASNRAGQVEHAVGLARRQLVRQYGRLSRNVFERAAERATGDRQATLRALGRLSGRQRQAALVHFVDGLDPSGVARVLGWRSATTRRAIRRARSKLGSILVLDPAALGAGLRGALANGESDPQLPSQLPVDVYGRLAAQRRQLAVSGRQQPSSLQSRSSLVPLLAVLAALGAAAVLLVAPQPSSRSEPTFAPIEDLPLLSSPDGASGAVIPGERRGPVTEMPIYPAAQLPFELIAVEPATGSVATVDLADGVATVYQAHHSLLARLGTSAVATLGESWVTQAEGLVWWFASGIADPPTFMFEDDRESPARLEYVVAHPQGEPEQPVWAVQPGPGYRDFNEPSIVWRIPISTPSQRFSTLAPPDVRPVMAGPAGLLLNQSGWIEVGTVHIEDPATRKMMVVAPDGRLMPLWSGLGLDLRHDRLVWVECLDAADQCHIVVSELVRDSGGYTRGSERVIGNSAISLLPVAQPGIATVSPDGRWLVAERHFTDGRPDVSFVLVDLRWGEVSAPIAVANAEALRGPRAVWSADSEWLLVTGDAPFAIRVADGFTVDLWDWIPTGMEIRAIAPR